MHVWRAIWLFMAGFNFSLSQIDYLSVLECQVLESGVKLDLLPALCSPNPGAYVVYACEGHWLNFCAIDIWFNHVESFCNVQNCWWPGRCFPTHVQFLEAEWESRYSDLYPCPTLPILHLNLPYVCLYCLYDCKICGRGYILNTQFNQIWGLKTLLKELSFGTQRFLKQASLKLRYAALSIVGSSNSADNLTIGSDWELSHPVRNCESWRLSF